MTQNGNHYSRQQLLQYLNIELLVEDMSAIEDHVGKCASCMSLLKELEPECNKSERDKLFDHTTEIIQVVHRREKDYKRLRLRIYLATIVLVVAASVWAFYTFNIFPKSSHEIHYSQDDDSIQTASSLVDNKYDFTDSTLMTSIIDVSETPEGENIETGILENNIENALPSAPIELPAQNSINNEGSSNSIQNAEVVISEPIIEEQNSIVSDSSSAISHAVQAEEPKQEAPVVERSGTIEVAANSRNQATPEVGYANYNQYIKNEFKYPDEAKQENLQGAVIVQFVVAVDGNVSDLKIVSGLSDVCNDLVKSIIQNGPRWKPFVGDDFVEYRSATLKFTFKI